MNFRQRLAWLATLIYLGISFLFLYYLFEISERYNKYALDHVNKVHTEEAVQGDSQESRSKTFSWFHLGDVPLGVWIMILFMPYLQVFLMILACTRTEPWMSWAFVWPGIIYMKYQDVVKKLCKNHGSHVKSINSAVYTNGNTVFHA